MSKGNANRAASYAWAPLYWVHAPAAVISPTVLTVCGRIGRSDEKEWWDDGSHLDHRETYAFMQHQLQTLLSYACGKIR